MRRDPVRNRVARGAFAIDVCGAQPWRSESVGPLIYSARKRVVKNANKWRYNVIIDLRVKPARSEARATLKTRETILSAERAKLRGDTLSRGVPIAKCFFRDGAERKETSIRDPGKPHYPAGSGRPGGVKREDREKISVSSPARRRKSPDVPRRFSRRTNSPKEKPIRREEPLCRSLVLSREY
ncbi:hypothetical protein KM043_008761 [Ampulex compressa]|nr:hypothetical protein KM043_008761 [Ampulex compressa]